MQSLSTIRTKPNWLSKLMNYDTFCRIQVWVKTNNDAELPTASTEDLKKSREFFLGKGSSEHCWSATSYPPTIVYPFLNSQFVNCWNASISDATQHCPTCETTYQTEFPNNISSAASTWRNATIECHSITIFLKSETTCAEPSI